VSDYVLFTAGPFDSGTQAIHIEFYSGNILLADLIANNPGFPWGGGIVEDGTLQDISGPLGTFATQSVEGLYVRLQSPLVEQAESVPEPSGLVLGAFGLALLGVAAWRRQRHA
jgi:MYXO-CTERM domain-containing protein